MLREIFRFELRYQLRQPIFAISAAIFFLLTFGAVTTDSVQIGGSIGNVHRNAPFVIMQILLVMSAIGVFVTTAFVANAVYRDFEYGTDSLFFSMPMKKRDYLLGRFSGSLVVALAVFLGVVLAIVLGSVMPWLEAERIGPFRLMPYVFSMLFLVLPNVFLTGGIFFSIATLTRSLFYTYAGVVLFFVGYGVGASLLSDLENEAFAAVLDPFGLAAFEITTKYWTVAERNTSILPLRGPLLYNRLLWISVALAVVAFTYARFRFTATEGGRKARRRRRREEATGAPFLPLRSLPAPAARSFSPSDALTQYLHQTRLETAGVLKGLPFLIILFLGVLNVVGSSFSVDQMFGTPVYPVTHLMLRIIEGSFLLFVVLLMTFYSGEIVWRERSLKLSEVFDALPVPTWAMWAAKMSALLAVLGALLVFAMLTGIGIQLFRGHHDLELPLYLKGLFLETAIPFVFIAVLALFFQTVANHKYLGFLLMVLFFISDPVLDSLRFQHNLYRYASTPEAPYSDMNGYGHFVAPVFWFDLYWAFGAVILLILVHLFWVRGTETRLKWRLHLARWRLTRPARVVLLGTVTAFLATGGFIFYNTNILNEYLPGKERERRQAEFEKNYKQYEGVPGPRITSVQADVDIHPDERTVAIRGRYTLLNKTGMPVDVLHLTLNPEVEIREIRVPGARLETKDSKLGYYTYRLDDPMEPGAQMELAFDLRVTNEGFVNNDSNTKVVYNGTFFDSYDCFPHLGYARAFELQDPNARRKHGLPPIQRMPKVDDLEARFDNYVSHEADWVAFETTVSTSPDQIAIAPGYLEREWQEAGRRYFHYKMDVPILGFFSYLSARYEVKRDRWNDVAIEIYYHPAHPYNVDRMIDAIKKSLDYFTTEFGPYQHKQVRIVEFPRYARFAQSFPNTIPFSESIGFIARLEDEDEIDYVFYVTAHEVAHQWWAHQVISGNVQGATVLSETLSQYSALMVMEKEYGREKMRKFLKYELDAYLKGRGGELIEELPLILVEDQPYIHYRKGSVVMYALRDAIGEEALNAALARYVRAVGFQEPPYTYSLEFLSYLEDAVPEDRQAILDDFFRNVTLYENRAVEAICRRRDDGKYLLRLTVESAKFRADGAGVETEVAIGDWIDVGVFGDREPGGAPEGKLLTLEKRRIEGSRSVIEMVMDEEPKRAGIDPFNKLIDRNPENNLMKVALASAS